MKRNLKFYFLLLCKAFIIFTYLFKNEPPLSIPNTITNYLAEDVILFSIENYSSFPMCANINKEFYVHIMHK